MTTRQTLRTVTTGSPPLAPNEIAFDDNGDVITPAGVIGAGSGGGSSSGNIDGGTATTIFTGIPTVDGGNAAGT